LNKSEPCWCQVHKLDNRYLSQGTAKAAPFLGIKPGGLVQNDPKRILARPLAVLCDDPESEFFSLALF